VISTLIVEDDYHVATIHAAYLRKIRGFTVAGHASTAASARSEIRRLAPTLVLLDLYLPDGHGLDLVRESLASKDLRPDFLVITAARDMGSVRAAMQLGTVHYLVKPFSFAQLEERLNAYRDLRGRLERIDEAEQHDVDTLYGLLRGPAPLPKGQSGPTMARIREHLRPGLARAERGCHRRRHPRTTAPPHRPSDRPANCRQAQAQALNARRIAGEHPVPTRGTTASYKRRRRRRLSGRSPRGRTAGERSTCASSRPAIVRCAFGCDSGSPVSQVTIPFRRGAPFAAPTSISLRITTAFLCAGSRALAGQEPAAM
jgi:response regulator of citrate/malate metabolism